MEIKLLTKVLLILLILVILTFLTWLIYKIIMRNNKQKFKECLKLSDKQQKFKECLEDMSKLLTKNNIYFFLVFGTALGCHREKKFIAHDHDIDLGVFEDTNFQDIIDSIKKSKLFKLKHTLPLNKKLNEVTEITYTHIKSNINIDIFKFYKDKNTNFNNRYISYVYFGKCDNFKDKRCVYNPIIKIIKMNFMGKEYNVPDISFLESHYGSDWYIPKKLGYDEVPGIVEDNFVNYLNCNSIKPNIKNIHLLWEFPLTDKSAFKRLVYLLNSLECYNNDRIIYIYSNKLTYDMVKDYNVKIVRWSYDEIKNDTPFQEYYINFEPIISIKNKDKFKSKGNWIWSFFSDIFRLIVIYKYGGSYTDTDNICIGKIPDENNLLSRTFDPHSFDKKNGYALINGKYREGKDKRLFNNIPFRCRMDPIINFKKHNSFIKEIMELGIQNYQIDNNIINSQKMKNDNCWQNLLGYLFNEDLKNNIKRVKPVLLLAYLPDGRGVYNYSSHDKCENDGELCQILNNNINFKPFQNVGNYKTKDKKIASSILYDIYKNFPYVCFLWSKTHYDFKKNKPQKLSNWLVNIINTKCKN